MKFSVEKGTLEKAMMQLDAIVPGRDTQTLLSNVLVSIQETVIKVTASDMESTVRISMDAGETQPGELIVKAKKLFEIARQLNSKEIFFEATKPEEEEVSEEEGLRYLVRVKGKDERAAKFRMTGSDRSHFPELNEISSDRLSMIPADILSEMLEKTFFSISQEDNRYIYNGIYFKADGKRLTLVGTDGRRLAAVTRSLPNPIDLGANDNGDIVVHAKAIRELQKIIEGDEEIEIGVEQRDIFFRIGQAELSSRLLEGKFPDYKKVIPETAEFNFEISRDIFIDAIRQVMVMTEQPSYQIKMAISGEGVVMNANTPDVGEAEISLPVKVEGADMEIGFNANYFMDILKNLQADVIRLKFTDPTKPIVFEDPQDADFVALVMPMKI